jgi:uncharacterized protein YlxP (DUF503 family)
MVYAFDHVEIDKQKRSPGFGHEEMMVGILKAHLHMHGLTSLKQKRSIVKSVIGRIKSRYNVSVSEVDHQDNRNNAVIGMSVVSNDAVFIDKQFDTIVNFMQNDGRFYLGRIERETFSGPQE